MGLPAGGYKSRRPVNRALVDDAALVLEVGGVLLSHKYELNTYKAVSLNPNRVE